MLDSTGLGKGATMWYSAKDWFFLFRPWSYMATLVPFLVSAGVFSHAPAFRWGYWTAGLVVGLLFQATVNLLNTWGDERSGVDDVPGAICTTPQIHDGRVSMRALLVIALTCAGLASVGGVALCFYVSSSGRLSFNGTLLGIGVLGFLGATNYSTGFKFKYRGLGVPFVSFLMGPLEILAAIALGVPEEVRALLGAFLFPPVLLGYILYTVPIAALVGVVMHGNDMRDIPTDRAAGIVTLASRLGPKRALAYYRFCHVLPYVVTCIWILLTSLFRYGCDNGVFTWAWLPLLAWPLSLRTIRVATRVYRENPANPTWRRLERASGSVLLVYGVLYAFSFALI